MASALITMMDYVARYRPRLIVGEGQGGVVVGMSSFPAIVERACRDRAVTEHQMGTFRRAWSGVTGLLVIDPVILPTSNNVKYLPFQMLKDAFPSMEWHQPRGNRRGVYMSGRYLIPPFAVELGERMGTTAEQGKLSLIHI